MSKINLIFFYHAGANCQYFEIMLKALEGRDDFSYKIIRPSQIENTYFSDYDVLVYQTFPDNKNLRKHNPVVIKDLDNAVWHKFKGFKILLDSFDMGGRNGYKRFGTAWPRIKHVPSYKYLKRFNVISIICTTGWIQEDLAFPLDELSRPIVIHSAFTVGVYPHKIRERVMEILQRHYLVQTSSERIPVKEYNNFLRKVRISIVTGGFGETSGSAYPALRAGALLFVHEDIQKVKLLPFANLVDGEDYVSFNESNFIEKLDWILLKEDKRNEIRLSGQMKYIEGFDPRRSAVEFLKYLKANVVQL